MAKKLFSLFLALLIYPLFFFGIFVLVLKFTVANPEFIKKEFVEQEVYSKVYDNLDEIVNFESSEFGEESEGKQEEQPLYTKEEIVEIAKRTVEPDDLKLVTETAVDTVLPWFLGLKEEPVSSAFFVAIKEKADEELTNAFRQKYEAMPYCDLGKEFTGDLNTCRPQGVSFDDIFAQFQEQAEGEGESSLSFLSDVPDNFNLKDFIDGDSESQSSFGAIERVRSVTSTATNILIYLFLGVLLVILFLLCRVFSGRWKDAPIIFGIFLLVYAVFIFVNGILISMVVVPEILDFAVVKIDKLPTLQTELVVPLINDITAKMSGVLNYFVLGFFAAGVIVVLFSYFLTKFLGKESGE